MKLGKFSLILIAIVFRVMPFEMNVAFSQNNAPVVTNVQAEQRANSQKVDITFNVQDADNDLLYIMIQASSDNGTTYNLPVAFLEDSVGYGIFPNSAKKIVWNAGVDYPEHYGDNYKIKVLAIDAPIGKFVKIATDTFTMGDNSSLDPMKPEHIVTISSFYMGATEITNIQYKRFCDATGRSHPIIEEESDYFTNRPDYPVVNVTWFDAIAYCNWYSQLNGFSSCYNLTTGECDTSQTGYRLPSEAEWEFVARGGIYGKNFPWGTDSVAPDSCNYQEYNGVLAALMASFENDHGPLPVASFNATAYGLYDLAGNVSEWCNDWYDSEYYDSSLSRDPMGATSGSDRVCRGGDWKRSAEYLRVFQRDNKKPDSLTKLLYRGFRIVRRVR